MHVTISVTSRTGSEAYLPRFHIPFASSDPRPYLVTVKIGDRDQQPLKMMVLLGKPMRQLIINIR